VLVLDGDQVAVVHVDPVPLDLQPGAAVEHTAAPAADLGDVTGPAESAQCLGFERAPVVDRRRL
jgi:hypothetical protein